MVSQRILPLVVSLVVTATSFAPRPVAAYSPDSPEVQAAVERAAAYLATAEDRRLGAKALAARVMIYLRRPEHPLVADAVGAAQREITGPGSDETRIYSLGLAIAMLCELDAEQHRETIGNLVGVLVKLQKDHGGWGYPSRPTGDTSMTQYAVYGLWNADRAGIKVDENVWVRGIEWLLRTQDPGGGWGYQGTDPGDAALVEQAEIRRSMTEAALASLYLGGERFRLWRFRRDEPTTAPPQLRVVEEPLAQPGDVPLDAARLRAAIAAGNRWDVNSREPIYRAFPCYHLYTIERYHTFQSASQNGAGSTQWYDAGVEALLSSQEATGAWQTPEGPVPATAFAALFLLRATRAAVVAPPTIGGGTLIGGRGVPIGGAQAPPGGGSPPRRPTASPGGDLAELAKKLEDPRFLATLAGAESQTPLPDAPPPDELQKQLTRLAKSDSPAAQAAALAALGRTDDFDNVPLLIEAIRDPRPQVHQAAVDALRYMARRSEELGRPLPSDEPSRFAEATRWREWYRSIRPPGR